MFARANAAIIRVMFDPLCEEDRKYDRKITLFDSKKCEITLGSHRMELKGNEAAVASPPGNIFVFRREDRPKHCTSLHALYRTPH